MARTPVQVYTGLSVSDCLGQYGSEDPPRTTVSMHSTPSGGRKGFDAPTDAPTAVMTAAASCRNERCSRESAAWRQRHGREGSTLISDGLRCFSVGVGCQHRMIVCGGRAAVEEPGVSWVNSMLGTLKTVLRGTCHSFRLQYAQRSLSEFQYRVNRRSDLHAVLPRRACGALETPPMPERLLKIS